MKGEPATALISRIKDLDVPEPPRSRALIDEQYAIAQIIGQGTFGKVFKAQDRRTNALCALKVVLQQKKYKNRQLSIISSIDHHNVVQLLDHFYTHGGSSISPEVYLNLVTNLMPTSLYLLLRSNKKKPVPLDALAIKLYAFQMFKALAYFEDIGLGHRDIKPMNLLVDPQSHELRVCDFGSAKILRPQETNITYMCSRYYRAPELLFGFSDYSTEIDVWSVGCVLVEMITREPLFAGENTIDQIIEIVKVIGVPTEMYLASTVDMRELKLPPLKGHSWKSLLRKYNLQPQFLDLISKVLVFDRKLRMKPVHALLHEYFHDLPSNTEAVAKLPNLFDFSKNQFHGYEKERTELLNRYNKPKEPVETAPEEGFHKPANPDSIGEQSTGRET